MLLLDTGNSLFNASGRPSATADPSQAVLPIEAMNLLGYDAMALGEQDLAAPLEVVQARLSEATFPFLSANLDPTGLLPNVQPYLLREVDGHTVALIGLTARLPEERIQTLGADPVFAGGALESVQKIVEEIGDQAEIIIVLSTLSQNSNALLAEGVAGLDAIIGIAGGGLVKPQVVVGPAGDQVVLHASGSQGKALGVLVLHFDAAGSVISFSGEQVDLNPQVADEPAMVRLMQKYGVRP